MTNFLPLPIEFGVWWCHCFVPLLGSDIMRSYWCREKKILIHIFISLAFTDIRYNVILEIIYVNKERDVMKRKVLWYLQ